MQGGGKVPQVGVALGGGGVRGAAHIGVLKELGRLGLKPSALAGTSSGALVAALYAAECDWDLVEEAARSLTWQSAIGSRLPFRRSQPPLMKLVRRFLGTRTIEELKIPIAITAFDVTTGRLVTFDRGPVLPALRASIALPHILTPARPTRSSTLIDGGVITSLPVMALRGVDRIIAVDVRRKHPSQDSAPQGTLRRVLQGKRWMYQQIYLALVEQITRANLEQADIVLRPEVGDYSTLDFRHTRACIAAGEEAVRKHAAEITPLCQTPTPR